MEDYSLALVHRTVNRSTQKGKYTLAVIFFAEKKISTIVVLRVLKCIKNSYGPEK